MTDTKKLALIMRARIQIEKVKSSLPMDAGDGVMLTDAKFFENQLIIQYTATLPEGFEIEIDYKEEFIEIQRIGLCVVLCQDSSVIECLENGFTIRYIYFDANGHKFSEIDITKEVFSAALEKYNEAMKEEEEEEEEENETPVYDETLPGEVEELQTLLNLPIMVDAMTRLDSVVGLPRKKVLFTYTLLNVEVGQTFPFDIECINNNLIQSLKNDTLFARYRANDVTFIYKYMDKEQLGQVGLFVIKPSDYK